MKTISQDPIIYDTVIIDKITGEEVFRGHGKISMDSGGTYEVMIVCKHTWKPSNAVTGKTHWCSKCDERK